MTQKHTLLAPSAWEKAPLSSTVTVQVRTLLRNDGLAAASSNLTDGTAKLPFYDRYLTRRLFVRFLYERDRKSMIEIVTETRRLGGAGDFAARMGSVVLRVIGKKRAAALDADFLAFLRGLKLDWEEVHRSLTPRPQDNAFVQIAFPQSNAIAWRRRRPDRGLPEARDERSVGARRGRRFGGDLAGREGSVAAAATYFFEARRSSRWMSVFR